MTNPLAELLRAPAEKEIHYRGYLLRRAESAEDRAMAIGLRQTVFGEEGFIDSEEWRDRAFTDQWDDVSIHCMVMTRDNECVGTTRFVLPSDLGFPTEHLFNLEAPALPRTQLGEFGRLAIAKDYRGGARVPMLGLLKLVHDLMIEHGIAYVFAFMPPKLVASYAALGCVSQPLKVLPPTRDVHAYRQPMRLYFERQQIQPVLFNFDEMMRAIGK